MFSSYLVYESYTEIYVEVSVILGLLHQGFIQDEHGYSTGGGGGKHPGDEYRVLVRVADGALFAPL